MRANRLLMAISAAVALIAGPNYGRAGDAAGPAIDVSLVTPDDFAAIVIHPRRIAQSPLVAELLKDEMIAGAIKKFGIDPSEVEQIVVLLACRREQPGSQPIPVIITRFTHDVDAKEIRPNCRRDGGTRPEPIQEVKVGGKTCLDLGSDKVRRWPMSPARTPSF